MASQTFSFKIVYSGPKMFQVTPLKLLICILQGIAGQVETLVVSCLPGLLEDHGGQWDQADPLFPVRTHTKKHVKIFP